MAAKKSTDLLADLELSATEVAKAEVVVKLAAAKRDAADDVLETKRAKVWKLLGSPLGSVRLGDFRFSRIMLLAGTAFAGMLLGSILIGPVLGLMAAGCVVAGGLVWIKSKL